MRQFIFSTCTDLGIDEDENQEKAKMGCVFQYNSNKFDVDDKKSSFQLQKAKGNIYKNQKCFLEVALAMVGF